MNHPDPANRDLAFALIPPLLLRVGDDGFESAPARLGLLVLAFVVAQAWRAAFAGGRLWLRPEAAQYSFALLFAIMLPGPVGWGSALLATSFGWVFAREIFGGKALLSPALVALAFAIFSFPQAGYEARAILSAPTDLALALACLPGAAWLLWRRRLAWPIVAGALVGAAAASLLAGVAGAPAWWAHFVIGGFAPGIVFLAAAPESAPDATIARWLQGVGVGALIVTLRLLDPAQPDGVILAALLGALFAPLLERAATWRTQRE